MRLIVQYAIKSFTKISSSFLMEFHEIYFYVLFIINFPIYISSSVSHSFSFTHSYVFLAQPKVLQSEARLNRQNPRIQLCIDNHAACPDHSN